MHVTPSSRPRRVHTVLLLCFMLGVAAPAAAEDERQDPEAWALGRPLQIVDAADLAATGHTSLGPALAELVPAFRFAAPFAVNGDDHVHTGTLRGLAPDQMVVLVDGKRQHTSARFYTSDQAGRGSVGFDLGLLPMAAVARVEIHGGGAGGRFGSGALAGVINIVLDDTPAGGHLSASFHQQRSAIEGVPRLLGTTVDDETGTIDLALSGNLTEDDGDGDDLTLQGSWGFELGDGFMRLSAQYRDRDPTNRAGWDPRQQYPLGSDGTFDVRERTVDRRTSAYGQPGTEELNILFNAGAPIGAVDLYGFTFLGTRNSYSYAPFVRPLDDANVPALYPDGFLPRIESDIDDRSFSIGVRGEALGWNWDLSYNQREDEIDLSLAESLNPTFGATSPTGFVTGNNEYKDLSWLLELNRRWQPDWLAGPLEASVGFESASTEYEIETGELAAHFDAGLAAPGVTMPAASVGFPGFLLEAETARDTASVFAATRAAVSERLTLGLAGRVDDTDDQGAETSVDLTAELELTSGFTARGALGSGFHLPSLAQVTFTRPVQSIGPSGTTQAGIYAPGSEAAAALGNPELDVQRARHASLGFSYRLPADVTFSLDLWQVEIDDRVVLSDLLADAAVADALSAAGLSDVTGVQIAVNGIDTRTRGIDSSVSHQRDLLAGRLSLDVAMSYHRTRANDPRSLTTTLGDSITPFGERAQDQLEDEQPDLKLVTQASWQRGGFDLRARAVRLGEVTDYVGPGESVRMGPVWLVDLGVDYRVNPRVTFGVGVENLLNEYPETRPSGEDQPITHTLYPFSGYAAYNASGRTMYARMSARFD